MNRYAAPLLTSLLPLFLLFQCTSPTTSPSPTTHLDLRNWAIQLQGADPTTVAHSGFDLVVIDYSKDGTEAQRYTADEIQRIAAAGTLPIAYMSIGEAAKYRFYWKPEWNVHPPAWLGKENPHWPGAYAVRFWHPEWQSILHTYLDKIIEQGFAGVFLDGVNLFRYWANPHNGEGISYPESTVAQQMAELIAELSHYAKSKAGNSFLILPLNGEEILKYAPSDFLDTVDGWCAESLFYNRTAPWAPGDQAWLRIHRFPYLDSIVAANKPVLSIDYVDDGSGYTGQNKQRIDDYFAKAKARKYLPYAAIADQLLDELNVIPGVQP